MFGRRREANPLALIGAAIIGMSAGVLLGVVIAPKKGKDLRDELYDKTLDMVDSAKELGSSVRDKIRAKEDDIFYYDDEDKLVFQKDFTKNITGELDNALENMEKEGKKFFDKKLK
ncbi:YtxH domain-containing protein [Filifactor villosus]|uniref:YtxH domain-containing protein n=1 Tax=Filifactor villosus TaxID=29374 RepID=A0ABV9QNN8_9FIRM